MKLTKGNIRQKWNVKIEQSDLDDLIKKYPDIVYRYNLQHDLFYHDGFEPIEYGHKI